MGATSPTARRREPANRDRWIIVLPEGEIMGEVALADTTVNEIGRLMSGVT